MPAHFADFGSIEVALPDVAIRGVMGGSGPPLLLLHGWPQNYLEWHRVAPQLARHFTVVATDLRGYGRSGKPSDGERHSGHSKRTMAADQVAVMKQLGFRRFTVIGHDRGGRVAHRMALDHPDCIERMVVIDIVPTLKVYSTVSKEFASAYFHWFFLIQPSPLPETLLANQGRFFLKALFRGLDAVAMPDDVFEDYVRCFDTPATLHAMCEDYRAAAGIDLEHDRSDLSKRIECPLFALWGSDGAMHRLYDVLDTWKDRGTSVTGKAITGGHWLPEQNPTGVLEELERFLLESRTGN